MHKNLPKIFYFISEFRNNEISKLNKNVAIIYRNYSIQYKESEIKQIKNFCKKNNRKIYLANNIKLALKLNLDGVYIPAFNKELTIRVFSNKKFLS